MIDSSEEILFTPGSLNDKRLEKRGEQLFACMGEKGNVCLNHLAEDRAENLAFHRFINNPKVTQATMNELVKDRCAANVSGKELICIQDTTEYNFQHHAARIKEGELGPVGNGKDLGFFAHPMLVMDAETEVSLGLGDLKLWHRSFERKNKYERAYKNLPIEEKESYRWIETIENTKNTLDEADHLTFISDRESDIYELWDRVLDEKTDLIIRLRSERSLYDDERNLRQRLGDAPLLGTYLREIKADRRKKRRKHTAKLELRSARVKIARPQRADKQAADYIELTAVAVKESPETVKDGEAPVHWILLTSQKAETYEAVKEVARKYAMRWQIEQLFRISKKKGLQMESSQLESGDALKNLCIMALQNAVKVLQLTQARDGVEGIPAEVAFEQEEIECLAALEPKYEGKTKKQQNPYAKRSLSWASWIIARMGGWKGYKSQALPGPISFIRGILDFQRIFIAWQIFKSEDV